MEVSDIETLSDTETELERGQEHEWESDKSNVPIRTVVPKVVHYLYFTELITD